MTFTMDDAKIPRVYEGGVMGFRSDEEAAAYLAGMIDGEGHVRHGLTAVGEKTISRYKCITITSTDEDLLDACELACIKLGIVFRRHTKVHDGGLGRDGHVRKPCWVTWISGRENLVRVSEIVPLQSARKKEALAIAIASYQKIGGRWTNEAKTTMRLSHERRWASYTDERREEIAQAISKGRRGIGTRTHCKNNHELSGDNVILRTRKNGRVDRQCRTCANEAQRRNYAKRKARSGA